MSRTPTNNTPGANISGTGNSNPFAGAPSFSIQHRIIRILWGITWKVLGAWTPPPMRKWRIFLLRLFGASIDCTAQVYGSAKIWYPPNLKMHRYASIGPDVICYSMGAIEIEEYTVVSQRAHLCTGTHDIHHESFQIYARPIHIKANAWVCAEAFVGPGVTIGTGAVLAARAAAFSDLDDWAIYRGNPAEKKGRRTVFNRGQPSTKSAPVISPVK